YCGGGLCAANKLKTVADELCEMKQKVTVPDPITGVVIGSTNNKGNWQDNYNNQDYWTTKYYYYGDFVKYNGEIWRFIWKPYNVITYSPGTEGVTYWKKIDIKFDEKSVYELNDVVKYGNDYYRSKKEINTDEISSLTWASWEKVRQTRFHPHEHSHE
ncbi:MAG: hypothetical protein RR505_13900, partial [Raoultibacter sp.]